MKKILYIISAIILGGVFAFIANSSDNQIQKISADSNITCDLNSQDCIVDHNGESITFSFYPRPLEAMAPLTLKVDGLKNEYKNLSLIIFYFEKAYSCCHKFVQKQFFLNSKAIFSKKLLTFMVFKSTITM